MALVVFAVVLVGALIVNTVATNRLLDQLQVTRHLACQLEARAAHPDPGAAAVCHRPRR